MQGVESYVASEYGESVVVPELYSSGIDHSIRGLNELSSTPWRNDRSDNRRISENSPLKSVEDSRRVTTTSRDSSVLFSSSQPGPSRSLSRDFFSESPFCQIAENNLSADASAWTTTLPYTTTLQTAGNPYLSGSLRGSFKSKSRNPETSPSLHGNSKSSAVSPSPYDNLPSMLPVPSAASAAIAASATSVATSVSTTSSVSAASVASAATPFPVSSVNPVSSFPASSVISSPSSVSPAQAAQPGQSKPVLCMSSVSLDPSIATSFSSSSFSSVSNASSPSRVSDGSNASNPASPALHPPNPSSVSSMPSMPSMEPISSVPPMPSLPPMSSMSSMSSMSTLPSMGPVAPIPSMASMASISTLPPLPATHVMPSMPAMGTMGTMPSMSSIGTSSSSSAASTRSTHSQGSRLSQGSRVPTPNHPSHAGHAGHPRLGPQAGSLSPFGPQETLSTLPTLPTMGTLPTMPTMGTMPAMPSVQVPNGALSEGAQWVEEVLDRHEGVLSLGSLERLLLRLDRGFFGGLLEAFAGLQNFLRLFPSKFSIITGSDRVFVKLNQRRTASLSPTTTAGITGTAGTMGSNSVLTEARDSNDVILSVLYYSCVLLQQSPTRSLKSVELANNIRDNLGSNVLQMIRNRFSGLLYLFEQYPALFAVSRIPKNDQVFLICQTIPEFPEHVKVFHVQKHSRCLHVGNLGPRLTEDELRREFNMFGDVKEVRIVSQGDRRYGFVYFSSVNGAEKARAKLIEKPQWKGNIAFAKKKRASRTQPKWN